MDERNHTVKGAGTNHTEAVRSAGGTAHGSDVTAPAVCV